MPERNTSCPCASACAQGTTGGASHDSISHRASRFLGRDDARVSRGPRTPKRVSKTKSKTSTDRRQTLSFAPRARLDLREAPPVSWDARSFLLAFAPSPAPSSATGAVFRGAGFSSTVHFAASAFAFFSFPPGAFRQNENENASKMPKPKRSDRLAVRTSTRHPRPELFSARASRTPQRVFARTRGDACRARWTSPRSPSHPALLGRARTTSPPAVLGYEHALRLRV